MSPFPPDRKSIRDLFPVTRDLVYLNHAGVSPISLPVKQAAETFLEESCRRGITGIQEFIRRGEEIREALAGLVGASAEEIAFIRSTSHGLSLVAQGLDWRPGDNVVTAACEFPANVYPWMNLEKRGVSTRLVPCRAGEVRIEDLREALDTRTRLVSLSWVEYGNGFRNDLARVGSLCRERGVLFCVDGIQGVGAIPLNLSGLPVDFLAADGHKWMLAPEGTGFLYVSRRVMERVHPVIVGWNSVLHALHFEDLDFTLREDARKFEEGSACFVGIMALGAAVDLLLRLGVGEIWEKIQALREHAAEGLRRKGVEILSPWKGESGSGILTFRSRNASNQEVQERLAARRIVTALRGGGIRISPHCYNRDDEIDALLDALG